MTIVVKREYSSKRASSRNNIAGTPRNRNADPLEGLFRYSAGLALHDGTFEIDSGGEHDDSSAVGSGSQRP